MSFSVCDLIEFRSDNPGLVGFKVKLNEQVYIMYYQGSCLKEVYFMSLYDNYFFSCRTDFKTLSHYFIKGSVISRYENGIYNRNYFCLPDNRVVCYKEDKVTKKINKIVYTTYNRVHISNYQRLENNLTDFLKEFYEKGL